MVAKSTAETGHSTGRKNSYATSTDGARAEGAIRGQVAKTKAALFAAETATVAVAATKRGAYIDQR